MRAAAGPGVAAPLPPFGPSACVDGFELPQSPFRALLAGNFSRVPLVAGDVTDEARTLCCRASRRRCPARSTRPPSRSFFPYYNVTAAQVAPCTRARSPRTAGRSWWPRWATRG